MVPLARGADPGMLRRDPCMVGRMDSNGARRRETEALIEAIWGGDAAASPRRIDPPARAAQNRALAEAMRAYLQQYLTEVGVDLFVARDGTPDESRKTR